jgi:hypothetical protein
MAAASGLIERALRDGEGDGEVDLPDEFSFTICGTFSPRRSSRRELISRQFRLGVRHASAKAMLGTYEHMCGGHIRSDRNKSTRPAEAGRVDSVLQV